MIADRRGRVLVPAPFDPDDAWPKRRHHVNGTVNAMGVRAVIEPLTHGFGILLSSAWRRGCPMRPRDMVTVELEPEGPQRDDLPDDLRAALDDDPGAAAFSDSLARFYRNAYRWIKATKRHPDQRGLRITEVVGLLHDGHKQRSN